MAKLFTGILGGGRGKVASVIMGRWKGINYIRAYAIPANPRTDAQVANRNKFASSTKKASVFTDYLRLLPSAAAKKSNFNIIVSEVFKNGRLLEAVASLGEGEPAFSSITVNKQSGTITLAGQFLVGDKFLLAVGTSNMLDGLSDEKPKIYEATTSADVRTFVVSATIPTGYFVVGTLIRGNRARTGVATSEPT